MGVNKVLIMAENPRDYAAALPHGLYPMPSVEYRRWETGIIPDEDMEHYDVVLLDSSPDFERALEITSALKKILPQCCVLLIGNTSRGDDILRAFRLGIKDYIKKPVDFLYIRRIIELISTTKNRTHEKRMPLALGKPEKTTAGTSSPIKKVLAHIEDHLLDTICIDDLSQIAGFSRYHFIRIFKQQTGFTPKKYIMYKRIELAKQLIGPDVPIGELTYKAGFKHISNFSKLFKRYTGSVPSHFKKNTTDNSTL